MSREKSVWVSEQTHQSMRQWLVINKPGMTIKEFVDEAVRTHVANQQQNQKAIAG